MNYRSCKQCAYLEKIEHQDEEGDVGLCRRFPPVVVPEYMAGHILVAARMWRHPVVRLADWCGEWKEPA